MSDDGKLHHCECNLPYFIWSGVIFTAGPPRLDFGINYIGCEHLQHLYDALRKETNKIVEDLEGDLYCGIALKWNCAKHHVDLTMVKHVMKQLTKHGHVVPLKPQHCPYSPNPIKYGKDNQAPSPLDDSSLLDESGKKQVQQIMEAHNS